MNASSFVQACELQLVLDGDLSELVRAFAREASLAEGLSIPVASLIADDIAQVWQMLCGPGFARERVRVAMISGHEEARVRILLHGYSRFSSVVSSLSRRIRCGAAISCHQHGIDGWEICIHRNVSLATTPYSAFTDEPVSAPAVPRAKPVYFIDLPEKSDAAAISRCFLEVYGHHYVHSEVFSSRRYWNKVESGELIPAVARDSDGQVIGHVALERQRGARVAERGEAVVLSAHRGHGLLERMTARLSQEAPKHDLDGIYAEPLTIHTFSQRNDERAGMPVCAVLLGANPESFRPKGAACPTAGQRQSYLRTFDFVRRPAPRAIHAPARYREILLKLYASLKVPVSLAASVQTGTSESRTRIKVSDRGYGMICFEQIGPDGAIELAQALRDVRALGASSVQLSAPLGDPRLPLLAESARALGFFFCGMGPAFADGAGTFLLQLLSEPLDTGKLQIFTELAKELVAFIALDRAEIAQKH
jgi:hypothetical protein